MKKSAIRLSEYSLDWPDKFKSEKIFLENLIGRFRCGSIQYVGNTAVKGLIASACNRHYIWS